MATQGKKILILGHGRWGKDQVAQMIQDKLGLTFTSSSWFVGEKAVYPTMREEYKSIQECFDDRHNGNNRQRWYQAICAYNAQDRTRLARELLQEYDMYVGMRDQRELAACKQAQLFHYIVWVDASQRLPPEKATSISVSSRDADYTIDNNGTLEDLGKHVDQFIEQILYKAGNDPQ